MTYTPHFLENEGLIDFAIAKIELHFFFDATFCDLDLVQLHKTDPKGDGLIWITPSQNSVILLKIFFGQKKILKNYKNWMVL